MNRILSFFLALLLLLPLLPAGAESAPPGENPSEEFPPEEIPPEEISSGEILSWDFALRFSLNPEAFPFRERKSMQGYASLLSALELRGTCAYCPATDCLDLVFSLVPLSDPQAALSFRVYGWVANWLNVSSPLLGDEAVCFQPDDVMKFVVRAWDFFQVPLFPLAVLFPNLTVDAFWCLADDWIRKTSWADEPSVIPADRVARVAEYWGIDLREDETLVSWIRAASQGDSARVVIQDELSRLPEILLRVSDGQALTVEREKDPQSSQSSLRLVNARGETLYEETASPRSFSSALTLPPTGTNYLPAFSFRREDLASSAAYSLQTSWLRTAADEEFPASLLRVSLDLVLPRDPFPADASLSGDLAVEGLLLPNFHFLLSGVTRASGAVDLSLSLPSRPELGPVFSVSGAVTPASYEGPLDYMIGDIVTPYDLFALTDETLASLRESLVPAVLENLPSFVCAMPARGIQSLLDTLEKYGLLQITLR